MSPWWLVAAQLINPSSMLADRTRFQTKNLPDRGSDQVIILLTLWFQSPIDE